MLTAPQPLWQAQLAADPSHDRWLDIRMAEDLMAFDDWLTTPEGNRWLQSEIEIDEEQHVRSNWKGW